MTALPLTLAVGFAVTLPMTELIRRLSIRLDLRDIPNERSSHRLAVPRTGGIGVILGFGSAVGLLVATDQVRATPSVVALMFGLGALGTVGLLDDLRPKSVGLKLAAQILCAFAFVAINGGFDRLPLPQPLDLRLGNLSLPLSILWMVGVANCFNFMDGIDGLAAGQVLVVGFGVILAGFSSPALPLTIAAIGPALAFLILNWSPARIFLGDCGSMTYGFFLAALPLLPATRDRPAAVLMLATGMALFLLDPLETIIRLVRSGHKIGRPHRAHSYQRMTKPGGSHAPVAAGILLTGLLLSVLGAVAYRIPLLRWMAVLIALVAFGVEVRMAKHQNVEVQIS